MDELRAAVRELAAAPSAAAADAFVAAVHRQQPSPQLAEFIDEALGRTALHEISDTRGVSVRWRLIDRLLSLGFPHALLVTPDDLDYHRARRSRGATGARVATFLVGCFSTLWSLPWIGLLYGVLTREHFEYSLVLASVAMFTAFGHGVLAVWAAVNALTASGQRTLRRLGWMFFVGPLVAVLAQLGTEHSGGALAMALGAPAMLTALLCAITASAVDGYVPEPIAPTGELPETISIKSRSASTITSA